MNKPAYFATAIAIWMIASFMPPSRAAQSEDGTYYALFLNLYPDEQGVVRGCVLADVTKFGPGVQPKDNDEFRPSKSTMDEACKSFRNEKIKVEMQDGKINSQLAPYPCYIVSGRPSEVACHPPIQVPA